MRLACFAATLALVFSTCVAWGPVLHKGDSSTVLRLSRDDDHEVELSAYRAHLEDTFLSVRPLSIDFFAEAPHRLEEEFALDGVGGFDWVESAFSTCGEDCEECEIPEAWKKIPEGEEIDVMGFLGIRRAEPIRVKRTQDRVD